MDTQTIEGGNRLIAEFMGWESNRYSNLPHRMHRIENGKEVGASIDYFDYHSSWNELIPVAEKVSKISIKGRSYVKVEIVPSGFVKISELRYTPIFTNVSVEGSLIKACWKAVVQFIQWYNTTNP